MKVDLLISSSIPRCRVKTNYGIKSTYFCERFLKPLQDLNRGVRIIAKLTQCLLCAWHFPKCFLSINELNPHNQLMGKVLFIHISLMRKQTQRSCKQLHQHNWDHAFRNGQAWIHLLNYLAMLTVSQSIFF